MAQEIPHASLAKHVDVYPFHFTLAGSGSALQEGMSRQRRVVDVKHEILAVPPAHAQVFANTRSDHIEHAESAAAEALMPIFGPSLVHVAFAALSWKSRREEHYDGSVAEHVH